MKLRLLFLLSVIALLSQSLRAEFTFEYARNPLIFEVIDTDAKTCKLKELDKDYCHEYYHSHHEWPTDQLIIPSEANGYTVTEIGDNAFNGCNWFTSLSLPNTIRTIGWRAFVGIPIGQLALPNSVTSIGKEAFQYCHLTSVSIPNSVTSIGAYAFCNNPNLTSVEIPNSITIIEGSTFYNCTGLTSVSLPNSVTEIRGGAFMNCTSLASIYIPESVKLMAYGPFEGCSGLKKAEFASIESLCNIEFRGENSNPLSQAHHLFVDGEEVFDLIIPETITQIGDYTFLGGNHLTSVIIPDSVESIGSGAFAFCNGITSLDIPNSVNAIGNGAFGYCTSLTSVEIPNSLSIISAGLFYECSSLASIRIPNSVSTILPSAFQGCSGLKSIEIPNSVTTIYASAFTNCNNLASISLPNSISTLASKIFMGCSSLASVEIPNSVTTIGSNAFSDCHTLSTVVIPNSVKSIYNEAYSGCIALDSINIGYGIEQINDKAFIDCPLTNICITTPIPPKVSASAFTNYSATLHLQGEASAEAYGADEVWGKFKRELMIEPKGLTIDGVSYVSGEPGETFQLKADIYPANVTLPYIYWRSTNPRIATVDNSGLVTLLRNEDEEEDKTRAEGNDGNDNNCKIIAESLYYDGPIAEVTVYNSDFNGVESVMGDRHEDSIDYGLPYEVYNISGVKVGESKNGLENGFYILRQGKTVRKIFVK